MIFVNIKDLQQKTACRKLAGCFGLVCWNTNRLPHYDHFPCRTVADFDEVDSGI